MCCKSCTTWMLWCKACRLAPGKGISASHFYSLLLCCLCGIAALVHTIVHVIHHCSATAAAAVATAAAAATASAATASAAAAAEKLSMRLC